MRENGYSCSAFVLDETRALTAAHCVGITEHFMKTTYHKLMKGSLAKIKRLKEYQKGLSNCMTALCDKYYAKAEELIKAELKRRKTIESQ